MRGEKRMRKGEEAGMGEAKGQPFSRFDLQARKRGGKDKRRTGIKA